MKDNEKLKELAEIEDLANLEELAMKLFDKWLGHELRTGEDGKEADAYAEARGLAKDDDLVFYYTIFLGGLKTGIDVIAEMDELEELKQWKEKLKN